MIKRIVYFGYYLKKLDTSKFSKFSAYVAKNNGINTLHQWFSIFKNSLTHNISILEYYMFNFYKLPKQLKSTFAGTGYMYEYQKLMNPKASREVLNNKILFLKAYAPFIKHHFVSKEDFKDKEKISKFLQRPNGKLVLKHSTGQCGEGIVILSRDGLTVEGLEQELVRSNNDMVEEFIEQHEELNAVSNAGLNTIRIISQLTSANEVDIVAARLRLTVNSSVDNLAAGNIAAPIDLNTGLVNGPAVYSDITKAPEEKHPVSQRPIVGFQIPFWQESMNMVKEAAILHPENRSIGWDVAITNSGPELLEGNHDWCKLLWQLPAQKGLKSELETYKKDYLKVR